MHLLPAAGFIDSTWTAFFSFLQAPVLCGQGASVSDASDWLIVACCARHSCCPAAGCKECVCVCLCVLFPFCPLEEVAYPLPSSKVHSFQLCVPQTLQRDANANTGALDAMATALSRGGALMIFPEGISHDESQVSVFTSPHLRLFSVPV